APRRRLLAAGQVRLRPHGLGPAGARRGVRPHLLRPGRPDLGDRALRPGPRDQVRDLRDHPHQGRDHRRAALAGLGAPLGPRPRAGDRASELQARARVAARPDRRGDGLPAGDDRRGVPGRAAADLQLDRRRARRAVDRERFQWRPGLTAGHPDRRERARPVAGHGLDRAQGPLRRRDRAPARAGEARRRALLLREPDAARDRRGPRRDRVARLPAAHEGRPAVALAPAGRRVRLGVTSYRVIALDEIEAIPGPGSLTWRPVRATLGLKAFGTNAYTAANAGEDVVEPHTEEEHEELYF